MPKILFLGASWFQLPPIEWARAQGHTVITTDNRPDNPGHALAHRAHGVSTVDAAAVVALARREAVDAVLAYASDVSAPAAALAAQELGLRGNPVAAVATLCDKSRFREFQRRHGLPHPRFVHGADPAALAAAALALPFPVVAKPVDSSGSRGVSLVREPGALPAALANALAHSRAGLAIVEEYLVRAGHQLTGDGFVVGGRLVFRAFSNEHFCPEGDPCSPVGESLPAAFPEATLAAVHAEVQRYLDLLGMRSGALNFDILLLPGGGVRVIEIGPRCGGNHIPWLIRASTGVDLARAAVQDALGEPVDIEGDGGNRPHASLNLVDLLASRGLRAATEPHRLVVDGELRTATVASCLRLRGGRELPWDDAPVFAPTALDVGFALFRFDGAAAMLAAMADLGRRVRFVPE